MREIAIERCHPVTNDELNVLFASAWTEHQPRDFAPVLQRSLAYFTAHHDGQLIGFVNVAWDGGLHGFIVDTTVHPDFQRRGIGLALLRPHDSDWGPVNRYSNSPSRTNQNVVIGGGS